VRFIVIFLEEVSVKMSSAISYYSTKNRASARLDNKKNEISRASAYMIDTGSNNRSSSYTPSYSTLKRESSFTDSSRTGRNRYRDHSTDYSTRPSRRSSSLEISAPIILRTRDISTDLGSNKRDYTNGISSTNGYTSSARTTRTNTTKYDDEEHSEEYKKIMSSTDKYLTMSKYNKADKETSDINGMIEEERRSKAYSKIINQQTDISLEKDCTRSALTDMFVNTGAFSAKTMQAINKEILYKEDKGTKNYSWRKDMESYEDNLEKMNEHKRNVRESTKATRDVSFKDTNSKIRDYDRESRRNVDYDSAKSNSVVINNKPNTETANYKTVTERNNNNHRTNSTVTTNGLDNNSDSNTEIKRGSWRKDLEKYEEKNSHKNIRIDSSINATPSSGDSQGKTYSWKNPKGVEKENTQITKTDTSTSSKKTENVIHVDIKTVDPKPVKTEDPYHVKPTASWVKPQAKPKVESLNTEPENPAEPDKPPTAVATLKNPESIKKEELKLTEQEKPVSKLKKPASEKENVQLVEPVETEKPKPKWKKPENTKKEESKHVQPEMTTPELKKTEDRKKEESKTSETGHETNQKEKDQSKEPGKTVPKWKKPEIAKKEEPKAEETKPVPKWKKQTTAKKEEPKPTETEKTVPKWKKQVPAKKEDPKPAETEKPMAKWKKPDAPKKEETKPTEPEKPSPKWKKPAASKNIESKPTEPENTVNKCETKPVPEEAESTTTAVKDPEPEIDRKVENNDDKPTESPGEQNENKEDVKTEEEKEEEDVTGMRAMRKEQASKFADMDTEFAAGASKLSALRAKMKALRMKHKASAEADAAADAARK